MLRRSSGLFKSNLTGSKHKKSSAGPAIKLEAENMLTSGGAVVLEGLSGEKT